MGLILVLPHWVLPKSFPEGLTQLYSVIEQSTPLQGGPSMWLTEGAVMEGPPALKHMLLFVQGFLFVGLWLYYALSEAFMEGGSLGKKIFNLSVVRLQTGEHASRGLCLARSFFKTAFLGILSPLMWVGFLMALFTKNKQTLHDWLFKTTVAYSPRNLPRNRSS